MLVREGDIEVAVPEARDGASEGGGEGVFFNPTQELNRDITVATLRAYREREPRAATYLDAMAASGIRGVRAAAAGYDVTCADVDPDAVELARENLARNDLEGEVVERDVNALLYSRDAGPFDVVDVDPFGTPIPFADAALANARNLVCVTATDTAPLCGAHFESGVRKYSTVPRNTDYHPEMGLRVLLSALVRTAARYDKAATPILSHVSRHYARTYLEVESGARGADARIQQLGYVYHCQACLAREHEYGLIADPPEACATCGKPQVVTAGPIWLGPVADSGFARSVRRAVSDDMGTADRARRLLETVETELETPTHYDQHRLCKQWTRSASAMDDFLDRLRGAGFEASRAHYSGTAFKTDASVPEIRDATAPAQPEGE
jgi:tRNA (guanine26-N2/guanine27-N2)-dimethyltransferase